jgi:tetratricopeptide (TPR) repeat protein
MTLGTESLNRNDFPRAEAAFRTALQSNPQLAGQVMQQLRDHSEANVSKAIPDQSTAMRLASQQYLQWPNPDPKFLRRCLQFIRCGGEATLRQRAECQALVGRIHFYLEAPEEGIKHFSESIKMAPEVANYRVELIEYLLKLGKKSEAMAQARLGRQSIPEDRRFQKFVDEIAEADRERLMAPEGEIQVDPTLMKEILK